MIKSSQDASEVWVLDEDPDRLNTWTKPDVSPLRDWCPGYIIRGFSTVEATDGALRSLENSRNVAIVITDSLGCRLTNSGEPLLFDVHRHAPTAMVALFSNMPIQHLAGIKKFGKETSRIVDITADRSAKDGLRLLAEILEAWTLSVQLPAARRIRDYLDKTHGRDFEFFEDGFGGYLTLSDIYHEIVNRTPLGSMLEQTIRALPDKCFELAC